VFGVSVLVIGVWYCSKVFVFRAGFSVRFSVSSYCWFLAWVLVLVFSGGFQCRYLMIVSVLDF